MQCIGYISFSRASFSNDDLIVLAAKANAINRSRGITGILCYRHGMFMQFIEGDDDIVVNLMNTIALDQRHGRITQIYKKRIFSRLFSSWGMALKEYDLLPDGLKTAFQELASVGFKQDINNPEHQRHIESFIAKFVAM